MANQFYISAGLTPKDNASGATSNSFYISAGLTPDDVVAAGGGSVPVFWHHYSKNIGSVAIFFAMLLDEAQKLG